MRRFIIFGIIFGLIALAACATGCKSSDTTTIVAGAGVPTYLTLVPDSTSVAIGASTNINATLTDAAGTALAGETITFTISSSSTGGGTLNPSSGQVDTDSNGQASIQFTGTTAGTVVIAGTVGTTLTQSTAINVTTGGGGGGGGGSGTVTVSANPTSISTSGQTMISANAKDASGNNVADGTTITFTLSSSSMGVLSSATGTTTGGTTVVFFTAGITPGSVTITAAATIASATVTGSAVVTITATAPAAMSVSAAPTSIPAQTSTTITAHLVDNVGQPVANTIVTFSLGAGSALYGSLSQASAFTNSSGDAVVTFTAANTVTIATVSATVNSISANVPVTITGAGGSVSVAANPSSITVGGTTAISATVLDGNNNALANAPVTFSAGSTAANFSGSSTASATTNSSGIAGPVTLTGVSATTGVTISATAISLTGTATVVIVPSTSGSVTVTAMSQSILTNATTTVTAYVQDSSGLPVSGGTVAFSVNIPALASVSPISATTNTSGQAATLLTAANSSGSVIVSAVCTSCSPALSGTTTISITAPPPASVTVQSNPTSILVKGTTTITATVQDASSNPVPDGTAVTFVLSSTTYGTLSNLNATTANGNGQATTTFTASNYAGTVAIQAISGSVSGSTQVIIAPAPTGSIQFVSAIPQSIGVKGSGLTETSSVAFFVADLNGDPVADGTAVTFVMSGPGGGAYITGSLVGQSVATSSTVGGTATVTLHSGNAAGPVTIIATTYVNSGDQSDLTIQVNPTDTTIYVTSTSGFPSSGKIKIDNEMIIYSGLTATTFTGCVRGDLATTVSTHNAGTKVYGQDPISTSAGQISIGGGVPSAGHWNVTTSQFNLAGLKYSGLTANITAYIADRFGNYNILAGTVLNYYPEAGAIISSTVTNASGVSSATIRTQDPLPQDVINTRVTDTYHSDFAAYYSSLDNEPWRPGKTFNYNPRDGWVAVLSTTQGEEAFLDENGDGIFSRSFSATSDCPSGYSCECDGGVTNGYDQTIEPTDSTRLCSTLGAGDRSEAFVDLSEPYYDVNDNGKREDSSQIGAGYPFEQFIDANSSGAFDPPNGLWDGPDCNNSNSNCLKSKMIWKDIRLVFSGDYFYYPLPDGNDCYSTSGGCTGIFDSGSFAVADTTITKGGTGYYCIIIGDRNLNSMPGGTELVASASPSKSVTPSSVMLLDGLSIGPSFFCFTVSISSTETESLTVVSAGVKDTPLATINVSLIPFVITTSSPLTSGTYTVPYSQTLTASGGTTPYTWSWAGTTLPPGLSLSSGGVISGIPSLAGTYTGITVTVMDAVGLTATRNFDITIYP